jgi:F-type H+-transporting ATPase subunit delta
VADLGIRYATALFEISQESGQLSEYLEQALALRDNLQKEEPQIILTHPRISAEEKLAVIQEVGKKALGDKPIHQDLLGFIKLVIAKSREAYLLPALDKLVDMIKAYQNQATAKVVSAEPLTDEQVSQLVGILSRKLGKEVEVTVKVDPSVIAGISIHVDGYFLDRTVKTMLKDVRETLKEKVREGATNDSQTR